MPTMPTLRLVPTRPIRGFFSGASTFLGAIGNQLNRKNKKTKTKITPEYRETQIW
jgi:hypothetical protein